MKKIALALGLVAATAMAAPLSAQSRSDGPWWDPANTGTRSGSTTRTDTRDGRVYDDRRTSNDRVYDSRRADGQWRRAGSDRNGNTVYARTRYDSNRNLIREVAVRDRLGRYRVIERRVVQSARRDGRYDDRNGRDRNDRWEQNDGHDNGKHNGKYKNKNKNKNHGKGRGNR